MKESKPKVTICLPAEQDVFFQETQFDENLPGRGSDLGMSYGNRGADPVRYVERGNFESGKKENLARNANVGLAKSKKKRLKKAAEELEGHENKEEILKILRSE